MKIIFSFLFLILLVSSANAEQRTFTGSTPANTVVRAFIGIPLSDSIDFIRWKLVLADNRYELQCNYGISKPNTNGFINGGTKVSLSGGYQKEKNRYYFKNGTKALRAVELNTDLFHLLNEDNHLLVGNAGWSYVLNNITPSAANQVSMMAMPSALKDSMLFEGRTPCNIPGVIAAGRSCYKIKWSIVLYANPKTNEPIVYKTRSTAWRSDGTRKGAWKIITAKNGRTTYRLYDDKDDRYLYLLKLDDNILVFTDAVGKLLVGDEDFSYTLNRKW